MKPRNYIKTVCLSMALILVSCACDKSRQERTFTEELNKMLAWPEGGSYSDEAMQSVFDFIKEKPQSLEYGFEENSLIYESPPQKMATCEPIAWKGAGLKAILLWVLSAKHCFNTGPMERFSARKLKTSMGILLEFVISIQTSIICWKIFKGVCIKGHAKHTIFMYMR